MKRVFWDFCFKVVVVVLADEGTRKKEGSGARSSPKWANGEGGEREKRKKTKCKIVMYFGSSWEWD